MNPKIDFKVKFCVVAKGVKHFGQSWFAFHLHFEAMYTKSQF